MPPIAPRFTDQCNGFNKDDHRRCRLRSEAGRNLCKIHKNYFVDWFSRFDPWGMPRTDREKAEFIFQLSNNTKMLPWNALKARDQSLSDFTHLSDTFVKYFGQIVHCTNFNMPKEMPGTFKVCIQGSFREYLALGSPQYLAHETFGKLLATPEACWAALINIVDYLLLMSYDLNQLVYMEELKIRLCYMFNVIPEWKQLLYSQEIKDFNKKTLEDLLKMIPSAHRAVAKDFYMTTMDPILTMWKDRVWFPKVTAFKEELMMICWHPDRVQKYVDQLGDVFWDTW
jgi:hypothetical protein